METTVMSSKGQVIIPAQMRAAHGMKAGMRLSIEWKNDGLLLKPEPGMAVQAGERLPGIQAVTLDDLELRMETLRKPGRPVSMKKLKGAVIKDAYRKYRAGR